MVPPAIRTEFANEMRFIKAMPSNGIIPASRSCAVILRPVIGRLSRIEMARDTLVVAGGHRRLHTCRVVWPRLSSGGGLGEGCQTVGRAEAVRH